jgi:hypothetical protein
MALRRPRRRDGGSADGECGLAARSDPRGSRSKAGTGGAAEAQRPARARRTLLRGSRLAKHRFLRAIVCFQDVARRKISASIFFVMAIPPRPARWAAPLRRARRRCRGQAPISVLHRAISKHWAPFYATSQNRDLVILEARLPGPRTVSRRTRCCGSEASEAIPFPGADSIFSNRCGAISGRLRTPPLGWVLLAPSFFQGCRFFCGSNATSFHRQFWRFCIQRLP